VSNLKANLMPADKSDEIDFSSFLMWGNAAVAAAILVLFFFRGQNDYVNVYTACLSLAFAAQTHFFLSVTRKSPDPFLLLLVIHAICFYEFRVATLLWDPWSMVLVRNPLSAADLNDCLIFVIMANMAVFLGLAIRPDNSQETISSRPSANASVRVFVPVFLFFIAIILEPGFKALEGLNGYLGVVLNSEVMLLFSIVLLILYYGAMSRWQKILILCVVLGFIACRASTGSRSAILLFLFFSFCAWFAVKGHVVFKKKLYAAVAIAVLCSVLLFIPATLMRPGYSSVPYSQRKPVRYQTILDRIGFLDMSTDMIANSLRYGQVVNFEYYFKSIIDNGLTPGFNIFDAPKAANAISYVYREKPGLSLKAVTSLYQSDMLTLYGEAYILFGPLAGLAWIFALSFLFQAVYRRLDGGDPFRSAALRAAILVIFYTYFLESLGMDWLVVFIVRGIVPYFILLYVVSKYAQRRPDRIPGELL